MVHPRRPLTPHASARHYFGAELQRLRDEAGLSQNQLGELVHYSGAMIASVEKAKRWPQLHLTEAIDEALETDGALARLLPMVDAQREHEQRLEGAEEHGSGPDPSAAQGVERLADTCERMAALLTALASPLLAPGSLAGLVSLDIQPEGAGTAGPEDDEVLRLFLDLQDRLGGDDLYQPLVQHVDRFSISLRHRSSTTRLAALGKLLHLAGWLAIDSNRHGQARQHLGAALYIGHEVDDPALAASALPYMSLQEVYLDRPGKALALARTATDTA